MKCILELIMTGDIIDAKKALDIGLINKIVPEADLAEETKKYAGKLADKNPVALQLGKQSFYAMEDMKFQDALELSNYHFATLCSMDSAQKEVNKFLNKNKK